jgi:hypothetical protein
MVQRDMHVEIQKPQCISFSEFIPQWRVYVNTNFVINTIRLNDSALKNFIRIVGDRALNEYRAMDLEHYKAGGISAPEICRGSHRGPVADPEGTVIP